MNLDATDLWPVYENSDKPVEFGDIVSACERFDETGTSIVTGRLFSFYVEFRQGIDGKARPVDSWCEIEDTDGNDYEIGDELLFLEEDK